MPGDTKLDAIERMALALLAFAVTALNGNPFIASSGPFCLLAFFMLVASQMRKCGLVVQLPQSSLPIVVLWSIWVFGATLAMIANFNLDSLGDWFWVYLLPLGLLIAVLNLRPTRSDVLMILAVLAAGWLIRYGYAAFVFYQGWGVPNLGDLLLAHFDLNRIAPYAMVTQGNTSRTAAIMVPSLVLCSLSLALVKASPAVRVLWAGAFFVLAANALITGSRAQMFFVALSLALAGVKSTRRGGLVIVIGALLLIGAFLANLDWDTQSRFGAVLSGNRLEDASVRERMDSILDGLRLMSDHFFGVGPGRSHEYIYYSVSHQFAVFQGTETGVIGFLSVIALFIVVALKFALAPMSPGSGMRFVFRASAFAWFSFAMAANSPLGNGVNIPWIGLLALVVALGEIAPMVPVQTVPRRLKAPPIVFRYS